MLPLLLSRQEVRELVEAGDVTIRRALPSRDGIERARLRFGREGERLWIREDFASRRDGETIRVRYAVDPRNADARIVPAGDVASRFATSRYRSWPAKFMPRAASRLVVEVTAIQCEAEGEFRPVAIVSLTLTTNAL